MAFAVALAPMLVLSASRTAAQQPRELASPCSIDSAKALRIDTLTFYLLPGRNSRLDRMTKDRVAEIVAAHYERVPGTPLVLRHWTGAMAAAAPVKPDQQRRWTEPRGVDGEIRFNAEGSVTGVEWSGRSVSPTVEQDVTAAVFRADTAGKWKELTELHDKSGWVVLRHSYDTIAPGIPLLRTTIRFLGIEEPARVKKPFMPRYPVGLQASGVQGHVDLAFIIGTDGVAEPHSLEVNGGSYRYRDFLHSAAETVLKTTFVPATIQGCPVRQQVLQRISFKL